VSAAALARNQKYISKGRFECDLYLAGRVYLSSTTGDTLRTNLSAASYPLPKYIGGQVAYSTFDSEHTGSRLQKYPPRLFPKLR